MKFGSLRWKIVELEMLGKEVFWFEMKRVLLL